MIKTAIAILTLVVGSSSSSLVADTRPDSSTKAADTHLTPDNTTPKITRKANRRVIDLQKQRTLAKASRPTQSDVDALKKERDGFRNLSAKRRAMFKKFKRRD